MAKMKTKSVIKGIAAGIAVGTATMYVTNTMSKKGTAIKKNAAKAITAVSSMISAMQG